LPSRQLFDLVKLKINYNEAYKIMRWFNKKKYVKMKKEELNE